MVGKTKSILINNKTKIDMNPIDVFEQKLNQELPFCPKLVIEAACQSGDYYKLKKEHKDGVNYKIQDNERIMYFVKYSISSGRLFAPSEYIVGQDGTLEWFRWRFVGKRFHSVFNYWRICLEKHGDYFDIKEIGQNKYHVSSKQNIPHPSVINFKTKILTWKIGNKRVTISDYYRKWEQMYTNITPLS